MSKVPTRPYCTSCKKGLHGEHCYMGNCSCKCRTMSRNQIKRLLGDSPDRSTHTFTEKEDNKYEELMKKWRKIS